MCTRFYVSMCLYVYDRERERERERETLCVSLSHLLARMLACMIKMLKNVGIVFIDVVPLLKSAQYPHSYPPPSRVLYGRHEKWVNFPRLIEQYEYLRCLTPLRDGAKCVVREVGVGWVIALTDEEGLERLCCANSSISVFLPQHKPYFSRW